MQPLFTVYLNVYDVAKADASNGGLVVKINDISTVLGVGGVFHGGIEVDTVEWSYGYADRSTGVYSVEPKRNPMYRFRESLNLGVTPKSRTQVREILLRLRRQWIGADYDMLAHNCCHFCEAFAKELECKQPPGWLNRFAHSAEVARSLGAKSAALLRNSLAKMLLLNTSGGSSHLGQGSAGTSTNGSKEASLERSASPDLARSGSAAAASAFDVRGVPSPLLLPSFEPLEKDWRPHGRASAGDACDGCGDDDDGMRSAYSANAASQRRHNSLNIFARTGLLCTSIQERDSISPTVSGGTDEAARPASRASDDAVRPPSPFARTGVTPPESTTGAGKEDGEDTAAVDGLLSPGELQHQRRASQVSTFALETLFARSSAPQRDREEEAYLQGQQDTVPSMSEETATTYAAASAALSGPGGSPPLLRAMRTGGEGESQGRMQAASADSHRTYGSHGRASITNRQTRSSPPHDQGRPPPLERERGNVPGEVSRLSRHATERPETSGQDFNPFSRRAVRVEVAAPKAAAAVPAATAAGCVSSCAARRQDSACDHVGRQGDELS